LLVMSAARLRWDIFCKAIDNYGDAGVSWRLARILAAEHGLDITLWLDRVAALARIAPGVDPHRTVQTVEGVTVRPLAEPFPPATPADVVIDAFGCGLRDDYAAAMALRVPQPAWFVLEYLSAEPWVDGAHDRPSPHPRLPLARRFWFPGFTPATGGLLRERLLFPQRDAFRADRAAHDALWARLKVPPPQPEELRISLFCYPNPALPALLDAWADGDVPITCLVPEGVAAGALDRWAGGALPHPGGAPIERGRLRLFVVPFVAQDDYDRLLWACDVNFVRGEDSFVRAQWALRPFVWHVYPQAGDAHLPKLGAFLDRYAAGLDANVHAAVHGLFGAWNANRATTPIDAAWRGFAAARPHLERHGAAWARQLATLPELAAGLVNAAQRVL
jgi:uncharacterized repeat protein (TIGR03837 family)